VVPGLERARSAAVTAVCAEPVVMGHGLQRIARPRRLALYAKFRD